jgi:arylsulfatase A-like enzyme
MERVLPIRQVQDNPIYAGLVETVDDAIGLVLEALQTNGIAHNTIVIFTSDNGGVASGDHYATSNLPLRGGKGYQWEGGIKVPFFIKVPWFNNVGSTSDYPVIATDFYPTLLDLVGLPFKEKQHLDGISLKSLLQGEAIDIKRPLYWHYPHYGNQGGEPTSIIQQDGWKLIHYWEDGHQELYKLTSTEHDTLNVIAQHSEIAKILSDDLMIWLKKVNAKFPTEDSEFEILKAQSRYSNTFNKKWPALEKHRKKVLSKDFQPNENWWKSKVNKD